MRLLRGGVHPSSAKHYEIIPYPNVWNAMGFFTMKIMGFLTMKNGGLMVSNQQE